MAGLSVRLLGPPSITRDGIELAFTTRKALALLAFLLMTGTRQRREELAALFWPESGEQAARNALRYTLSTLKQTVGPAVLDIDRDSIACARTDDLWVDVIEFRYRIGVCHSHRHAEQQVCLPCKEALAAAAHLYEGEFMAGFTLVDSPDFDGWQRGERQSLSDDLAVVLDRLVDFAIVEADWPAAIGHARRRVGLDPLHEPAHQQLMRLYACAGRRTAALRQYADCARILGESLSVSPAPETEALRAAIRDRAVMATPTQHLPDTLAREGGAADRVPDATKGTRVFCRADELACLESALARACDGEGQVVFVAGEAGSGKTALLHEFVRRALATHDAVAVANGSGTAQTGAGDPYLPWCEIFESLLGGAVQTGRTSHGAELVARRLLSELVSSGRDLIGSLVSQTLLATQLASLPETAENAFGDFVRALPYKADRIGAGPQQSLIFDQSTSVLRALAITAPVVLVFDDLHWADAASIHLLFHLARRLAGSRLLIVGAYRPEDILPGRNDRTQWQRHPLAPVINELRRDFGDIVIDLDRANTRHGRAFIDALLDSEPNHLAAAFRNALYGHTEGQPLFTLELLRALKDNGSIVSDCDGCWVAMPGLDWRLVPARVDATLAERIGRLDEALRDLLVVASVEGERFHAQVVADVEGSDLRRIMHMLDNDLDRLHRLVEAHGVTKIDGQVVARYRFRHSLFQQYSYHTLSPGERTYLHDEVGAVLERLYGGQTPRVAVRLARHFELGGQVEKAARYRLEAGQHALHLSAPEAALRHLATGLGLLRTLPDTEVRRELELSTQTALGVAYTTIGRFTEQGGVTAFQRAATLALETENIPQLFPILRGLVSQLIVRADFADAVQQANRLLIMASVLGDDHLVALAHSSIGVIQFYTAEYVDGRRHLEQAIEGLVQTREPTGTYAIDPFVSALTHLAAILWSLGFPDQALARSLEALAVAESLDHPQTLAHALEYASTIRCFRREWAASCEVAEATIDLATSERLPFWVAIAAAQRATALIELGQVAEGARLMEESLATLEEIGSHFTLPQMLGDVALARARTGDPGGGLALIDRALAIGQSSGERWWETELLRRRGDLLLEVQPADEAGAEASYRRARELAQARQARSLELRACVALGRLLLRQGNRAAAIEPVASVYGWFAEGFDTADLQEATALLAA